MIKKNKDNNNKIEKLDNGASKDFKTLTSTDNVKQQVLSFYVSDELLQKYNLKVAEKKVPGSKVTRAAEQLYFNSKLNSSNGSFPLEARKNKLTCAFVKSELESRLKEKGFTKITDYLNAVLIHKLKDI